jgi:hypothetical protein
MEKVETPQALVQWALSAPLSCACSTTMGEWGNGLAEAERPMKQSQVAPIKLANSHTCDQFLPRTRDNLARPTWLSMLRQCKRHMSSFVVVCYMLSWRHLITDTIINSPELLIQLSRSYMCYIVDY